MNTWFKLDSKEWDQVKNNWLLQAVNRSVFILSGASLLCIIIRYSSLPPLVPIWYSRPWGTDQLAHPIWLLTLPLSGILIYTLNLVISIYFASKYLIFTQVIFLTSFLVNILSFISLVNILFLIT